MKRGRQGDGAGRPKKPIDFLAVRKLAALQCTHEEIASFLNLSVDTLIRDAKFCGAYKTGIDEGRMSLRRHQWRAFEGGNTTMLVWLSKTVPRPARSVRARGDGIGGGARPPGGGERAGTQCPELRGRSGPLILNQIIKT